MKRRGSPVRGALLLGVSMQLLFLQQAGACESAFSFPAVSGSGVLSISGESYRHREIYTDGEYPSLCVIYTSGEPPPDGDYHFQYRSVPVGGPSTARQRQLLSGGSVPQGPGNSRGATILSGSFAIQGGEVVVQ